ncbi:MAG: hypothetical protein HY673_09280 [Chloroflexi bacterium]|nr:hypothetical protein [Chloroflexota bacterium]
MATEIVRGKLLGVDRIGPNESALVLEVAEPMKPLTKRKVPLGGYQVTPDWVVKNMGYAVECVVVNGVVKSVMRSY